MNDQAPGAGHSDGDAAEPLRQGATTTTDSLLPGPGGARAEPKESPNAPSGAELVTPPSTPPHPTSNLPDSGPPPAAPAAPPAVAPAWPAAEVTARTGPPLPPKRRGHNFLTGAMVGGLIGALVAGGIGILFDRNRDDGTTRVVERVVPASQGPNTSDFTDLEPADIQDVLSRVEPAVVAITVGGPGGGSAGTGFVVAADGAIVTNNHVVEDADGEIEVNFSDGVSLPAEVLGRDASIDLAVIKVDAENLPTAELGDSSELRVGDDVIAIGNALALDGGPSVTLGIVSALNRSLTEPNGVTLYSLIQTDAAINPGNSGGPLVNSRGQVVGINTAIVSPDQAQNVGFAISVSSVSEAIEQLRAGEKALIPYLGVFTEPMTSAYADQLGSETQTGAIVREVTAQSGADAAGLRRLDILVEVAGTRITDQDDVATAVRQHQPGDVISLTFERDRELTTIEVQLGVRP